MHSRQRVIRIRCPAPPIFADRVLTRRRSHGRRPIASNSLGSRRHEHESSACNPVPVAERSGRSCRESAPSWLRLGPHSTYDGVTDDLVTGGVGADAMLGKRPGYADPLLPTAAELRRAALFLPGSAGQGFGRLFGPDVDETTVRNSRARVRSPVRNISPTPTTARAGRTSPCCFRFRRTCRASGAAFIALPVNGSWGAFLTDVVDFGYWAFATAARSSTPTRVTGTASTSWRKDW